MPNATDHQNAQLLAARGEHYTAMRVIGRATFKICDNLRQFGMEAVQNKAESLVLELSECIGVDSTVLGVLAMIGLEGRPDTTVTLVNATPPVRKQVESVGLSKLVRFAAGDTNEHDFPAVCRIASGDKLVDTDVSDTILEAHETLMNLDERNIPVFRDVVTLLKEEKQAKSEN